MYPLLFEEMNTITKYYNDDPERFKSYFRKPEYRRSKLLKRFCWKFLRIVGN